MNILGINRNTAVFGLLSILVSACNMTNRVEQTPELKREMKSVEIKRITNTQLIYSANEWGEKIVLIAEKSLRKELEKDPGQAGVYCDSLNKIAVLAALQKEYGVKIELLNAADVKNPALNAKEREILDAYVFSAKGKTSAGANLQALGDTALVYNAPVDLQDPICKACSENQDQPFAVWRLLFDKKEVIRKLDAKQLK